MEKRKKRIILYGHLVEGFQSARAVYSKYGICPTLIAGLSHGNTIPYIIIEVKNDRQDHTIRDSINS